MMQQPRVIGLGLAGALLLVGCAGPAVKTRPGAVLVCDGRSADGPDAASCAAAMASAAMRAAREATGAGWSMQGRVAVSTGQQSGSARLDWRHRGAGRYAVELAAPITRQTWELRVDPGRAEIRGMPEGPRKGHSASVLLREVTGWEIPVESLRFWLRGVAAPGPVPERHAFAGDGGLVGLWQDGWRIEFVRAGADALPSRITATRGDSRVRLQVDAWGSADGG